MLCVYAFVWTYASFCNSQFQYMIWFRNRFQLLHDGTLVTDSAIRDIMLPHSVTSRSLLCHQVTNSSLLATLWSPSCLQIVEIQDWENLLLASQEVWCVEPFYSKVQSSFVLRCLSARAWGTCFVKESQQCACSLCFGVLYNCILLYTVFC
jgi:hypothetical protein